MIKYKLSDVAKDLNIPGKELLEMVSELTGEAKKHSSPLTDAELNQLFEKLTTQNEEASLDAYLSSVPAPGAEKKKAGASGGESRRPPQNRRHPPRQSRKHSVRSSRKPRLPSAKSASTCPKRRRRTAPRPKKREVVTVTVDTRVSDVNLDKFNEKYTDLASTKNVENRRKPHAGRQQASSATRKTATNRSRKSARPRPSACSPSSWKRPAKRSSRFPFPTRSRWANWPPV